MNDIDRIPTIKAAPFGAPVMIDAWGRPRDWRLDISSVPGVIAGRAYVRGVKTIRAPRPDFSGRICELDELTEWQTISIGGRKDSNIRILRGADADGTEVLRDEAFFVSSGDCPTLIVYDPVDRRLFCAHCGRNTLWDWQQVLHHQPPRQYESVVQAILARIRPFSHRALRVYLTCGISERYFSHPETGTDGMNCAQIRAMLKHFQERGWGCCITGSTSEARISLRRLVAKQFRMFAPQMDPDLIGWDSIDTYSDLDTKGEPVWWSYRGAGRGGCSERNGIMVSHVSPRADQ